MVVLLHHLNNNNLRNKLLFNYMYSEYDKLFFDRVYINCPCGRTVLKARYSNHLHSMLHTNYLLNNKPVKTVDY